MRAVLLAVALAGLARAGDKDRKYYYEDIYSPFFAVDPERPSLYKNVRAGSAPGEFQVAKTAKTFRVFNIGGSTTLGYLGPYDLAHGLRLALPSLDVEVVNAGMSGYDSFRELLVEKQTLAFKPDALVFLTGHNDFAIRKSRPPAYWALRVDDLMSRFGWWVALHRRFDAAMKPRREPTREESLAELVANARDHVRLAKEGGAVPIFVAPPLNYRDNAPEAPLPFGSAAFMKGWISFLKRDWAGAREAWLAGLEAPTRGDEDLEARSFMLFGLARCEERLGLLSESRERYQAAVDSGRGYNWCARTCVEALKGVAREEGALWADAEGAFRRAAAPFMPGLDMLNDKIHWRLPNHRLVTLEVIAAMRADPKLGKLPWNMANLEKAWAGAAKEHDRRESALHLEQLLRHGTVDAINEVNLSLQSVVYLQSAEALEPGLTREPQALYRRARAANDEHLAHPQLWEDRPMLDVAPAAFMWNFGELELERGRYAQARECFKKTLALAPDARLAILSLALAQALDGDKRGAERSLAKASDEGLRHYSETVSAALGIPLEHEHGVRP